jgi:hypothetical protein
MEACIVRWGEDGACQTCWIKLGVAVQGRPGICYLPGRAPDGPSARTDRSSSSLSFYPLHQQLTASFRRPYDEQLRTTSYTAVPHVLAVRFPGYSILRSDVAASARHAWPHCASQYVRSISLL